MTHERTYAQVVAVVGHRPPMPPAMPPGTLRVITPKGHQSFPLVILLVIITFLSCNHNSFSREYRILVLS